MASENQDSQTSQSSMQSLGAQFLERHMKQEQTAFFVFIGVFMLLLIGIAVLFIYNGWVVRDRLDVLRSESLRSRFEATGAIAQAKAEAQTSREALQNELMALQHQTEASRSDIKWSLRATKFAPFSLEEDADRFARAHVLGWPLNDSSAQLVTAARSSEEIDPRRAALLDYALADWRGDEIGAVIAMDQMAQSERYEGFALAARAQRVYNIASVEGYAWSPGQETGCSVVANSVDEALAKINESGSWPSGFDDKGLGLNLYYFKGQCERKNGMAEAGFSTFQKALATVEGQNVSDATPYKFQAFHGAGSTLMVLANEDVQLELPQDPLLMAERWLWRAADLRTRYGQTLVGRVGSTENISFIYLRKEGIDRWDRILKHTEEIDRISSMTWNLTARLIAAHEKSKLIPASDIDGCEAMRRIIFDTGSKLSRRDPDSFDTEELMRLVTTRYAHYLGLAQSWADLADLERLGNDVSFTVGGGERRITTVSLQADAMINDALNTSCGSALEGGGD